MDIILYSTNCPRCEILEGKLRQKGFNFNLVTDIDEMQKLGIEMAPALQVDGKLMDFGEAVRWINGND